MKTAEITETLPIHPELIGRLGYREVHPALVVKCVRNGEPIELNIRLFKNRSSSTVLYYTTATYIPSNTLRHSTLFMFDGNNNHEALHKFCLYKLFFDETIEHQFEKEHKLTMQHPGRKAAEWLSWIRVCWNSNHFKTMYNELGGINNYQQIINSL